MRELVDLNFIYMYLTNIQDNTEYDFNTTTMQMGDTVLDKQNFQRKIVNIFLTITFSIRIWCSH